MNNRKLHTEPGQLLFVLDAYDFARAMRRWSTHNRATNYQVFRDPSRAPADAEEVQLRAMQWENRKTLARTETRKGGRSSLPIV
jgi:hypothetical protein